MTAPTLTPEMPVATQKPGPLLFWCGLGTLVAWIALIAWLTWTSSNPVTLNRSQIFKSDILLVGQVNGDSGTHRVDPVADQPWPFSDRAPITISNLTETVAVPGKTYLFPLKRKLGTHGYRVTPTLLPNEIPLIYPATPETMAQLKQILQERQTQSHHEADPQPTSPVAHD